jgi:hypothetical protein
MEDEMAKNIQMAPEQSSDHLAYLTSKLSVTRNREKQPLGHLE